jgi:hypothetical protein
LTDKPRLDNAGVADQGHQNRPFSISHAINKRPFENECKGTLCDADRWKPLGFHALNATRALSTVAFGSRFQLKRLAET